MWTESDSAAYQELADVAVPDRAEQMATLLAVLPFGQTGRGRVVELGCGEGRLAQAILEAYPNASVVALDGSNQMRAAAAERLSSFGDRCAVDAFRLDSSEWWPRVEGADALVSSLTLHHLDDAGKQRLFGAIAPRLNAHGALLVADLVQPQRTEGLELAAAGWDRAAEQQAQTRPGLSRAGDAFLRTKWNIFHSPDPADTPSPLFAQLIWLQEAGFVAVDCFWLKAGHAIYGGYRSADRASSNLSLPLRNALRAAEAALAG